MAVKVAVEVSRATDASRRSSQGRSLDRPLISAPDTGSAIAIRPATPRRLLGVVLGERVELFVVRRTAQGQNGR